MIEIKNLTKKYGDFVAVNSLNLSVDDGEICAFIGKNGAGKTTTIKCIVGVQNFEEGEITINGLSVKEQPLECKKLLAYIPDNPEMYDFMRAFQYLNFIADIFNIEKTEREEKINKYAEIFSLTNNLGQPISSFSHGMKQKLYIISALLHSPKLLVLDEPFVGLDPKSKHDLEKIMKDFTKNGCSILFSTHVLEVAEKLCDSVAIIDNGKIIKSGPMKSVLGDNSLEKLFLELSE